MKLCIECSGFATPRSKAGARCAECESRRRRERNATRHLPRVGACAACGRYGRVEIDHIVPLWAGGRSDPDNLRPLCVECHRGKTAADRRA